VSSADRASSAPRPSAAAMAGAIIDGWATGDHHAARFYGQICALVRAAGRQPRRRAADLMIAATAASQALPLYTANPADFAGAEGFVEIVGVAGQPYNL
jgi:hypothetical protein